jgi:hypothetical protein
VAELPVSGVLLPVTVSVYSVAETQVSRQKEGYLRINVTLRRVRVTIVAVEKQ